MAANMFEFLQNWFAAHPKYANLPFFIAAESYGGHYAPALGFHILSENAAGSAKKIDLKGILIGDGLVDPYHQYPSYVKFARMHQTEMKVSGKELGLMEAALVPCEPLIKACGSWNLTCQSCDSPVTPDGSCAPPKDDPKGLPCCNDNTGVPCINETLRFLACSNAYDVCNLGELIPIQESGINLYDVTKQCTVPPLCYDFTAVNTWLNDKANIAALGAKKASWTSCNREVEIKLVFAGDWMLSFAGATRSILEAGVPMLIYHGANDFIVNWIGGQDWTNALVWSGTAGFARSANTTYTVDGEAVGSYKSYGGLTFMKLENAGHLVPMDVPKTALDMVNKFMHGQPW